MGSSYIRNFINNFKDDDENQYKNDVIKVLTDLEEGNGLQHYLRQNVSDEKIKNVRGGYKIDWKRRYCTSNYVSILLKEYQSYFKKLDIDGSYPTLPQKSKDIIDYFMQKVDMNKLIKKIAKQRKRCGDVYVYYYVVDGNGSDSTQLANSKVFTGEEQFAFDTEDIKYPILNFRILESDKVQILPDLDGEPVAYIYTDKKYKYERNDIDKKDGGMINLFDKVEVETKIVFMRGAIYVYQNGEIIDSKELGEEFKGKFPLIHMQFDKDDGKTYSNNPFEDVIDFHIEMDRIESSIKHINMIAGHSQLVVTDGAVDEEHSDFGANSIVYVDTLEEESGLELDKKFQAKVQQLEIKNDLQTLKDEKEDKEEKIYKAANMPSPRTYRELLKTENSKVWENVRKSLESEIRDFYVDFIFKTRDIFEILLKINKQKVPKKPVEFKMPEFIIEPSVFDIYLLKAQKLNMKELSIQKNLKEIGLTDEEIKTELDNWKAYETMNALATNAHRLIGGASGGSTNPATIGSKPESTEIASPSNTSKI